MEDRGAVKGVGVHATKQKKRSYSLNILYHIMQQIALYKINNWAYFSVISVKDNSRTASGQRRVILRSRVALSPLHKRP